jgi:hypothetical protein
MAGLLLLGWGPAVSWAQAQGKNQAREKTFKATASVKTAGGAQLTAPVTVVVTRMTADAERASVADALKKGGTAAVVESLKAMPDAGYIEVGQHRTTLKYAYARPMSGGRLITVVAPTPIVHLGEGLPDAKPKAGFDLALAILEVKDSGPGTGELAPAATVKFSETHGIQTQDYGAETVLLNDVQQVKKK